MGAFILTIFYYMHVFSIPYLCYLPELVFAAIMRMRLWYMFAADECLSISIIVNPRNILCNTQYASLGYIEHFIAVLISPKSNFRNNCFYWDKGWDTFTHITLMVAVFHVINHEQGLVHKQLTVIVYIYHSCAWFITSM